MGPLPVPLPLDEALRRLGQRRRIEAGHVLLSEGKPPLAVYVVETGALALAMTGPSGNRIVLGILGPGAVFGEQSLCEPDVPIAPTEGGLPLLPECRAVLPCQIVAFDTRDLSEAMGEHPELARWLAASLSGRVEELHRSLARALSLRLPERTLDLLIALAGSWGRASRLGTGIEVPLTQDDLAAMLGVTRESVNRAVRALERSGAISRSGRRYVVSPDGSAKEKRSP